MQLTKCICQLYSNLLLYFFRLIYDGHCSDYDRLILNEYKIKSFSIINRQRVHK